MDTPDKRELIAANNSVEEIRKFVEADSLGYLSLEALRRAVGDDKHEFCYACYTGNYPTDLIHIAERSEVRQVAGNTRPLFRVYRGDAYEFHDRLGEIQPASCTQGKFLEPWERPV